MHSLLHRGAVVAAGLGLAAGALAMSPAAQAATVTQVRPADLVLVPGTVSGTTGTAKADFLAEGIHIKTTNNHRRRSRLLEASGVSRSPRSTPSSTSGSARRPPAAQRRRRAYYNIDIDGDGKADGQLIGELAYGGKDVWLNRDAEDFTGVTPTVPAGFFAGRSPCSGANAPQNGNVDGVHAPQRRRRSAHGTLDDWVRSLSAAGKTANLVSAGYVAIGSRLRRRPALGRPSAPTSTSSPTRPSPRSP